MYEDPTEKKFSVFSWVILNKYIYYYYYYYYGLIVFVCICLCRDDDNCARVLVCADDNA